ncbi:protein PROCA1 isoform X2 [Alligator mississippiensis]|uniref:protein PROCA1 isoform X2 n=1 Tax=Alligator mississippiensis TaxID=8496 RepID=UPI00287758BE|nr:protein PROCA1 isoform X2 [Alligator mississippiensis]
MRCSALHLLALLALGPGPGRAGFTYPGTLWCGAGSNADTYEQLGEHRDTDRCCREHDHCPQVIRPFSTRHGYRNLRWHTVSHCDCDRRLERCLRQVNSSAARAVGQAFFNVLRVPCFELAQREQCVEPYLYVWCRRYSSVAVAVAREPVPFAVGGPLIDGAGRERGGRRRGKGKSKGKRPRPPSPAVPARAPVPSAAPAATARPAGTSSRRRRRRRKDPRRRPRTGAQTSPAPPPQ